jgi:hypothetical protein
MPNPNDAYQARTGKIMKSDGTVVNEADGILPDGSRLVQLNGSNIAQPTDIQSRYAQTIQTHNAVSVGASSISYGSWIDADGFDKVGITFKNDGSVTSTIYVYYSNDGVSECGFDTIPTATNATKKAVFDIGARYVRVGVHNGDTAAHTMSAWAYLKA